MYIKTISNVDVSCNTLTIYSEVCPKCKSKMSLYEKDEYEMCEMCYDEKNETGS